MNPFVMVDMKSVPSESDIIIDTEDLTITTIIVIPISLFQIPPGEAIKLVDYLTVQLTIFQFGQLPRMEEQVLTPHIFLSQLFPDVYKI